MSFYFIPPAKIQLPIVKTALPTVEAENPERCDGCKFWQRTDKGCLTSYEYGSAYVSDELDKSDTEFVCVGECHRHPPVVSDAVLIQTRADILENHNLIMCPESVACVVAGSVWPMTWASDWCGEWRAKRVSPTSAAVDEELRDAVERVQYGEDAGCQVDDHDYRILAAAYLAEHPSPNPPCDDEADR